MSIDITVEAGKSRLLKTAGKVCDRDIVVTATGGDSDFTKQIIEKTVTKVIDDSITRVATYALSYCFDLTEVYLSNCVSVGTYALARCNKLLTADFPKLYMVDYNVFFRCIALKSVNIPIVTRIEGYAFQECSVLEKIDLPKTTKIGRHAFYSCNMLSTVILRSLTMATLESVDAFTNTPIANGTGYIYVPSALVDTYKADSNWSTYANQIRAIEDYPEITGL